MDFSLSKAQQETQQRLKDFCSQKLAPGAAELDSVPAERVPEAIAKRLRQLGEAGLLGLGYPEGKGGSGGDLFSSVLLIEELGRICASTALSALTSAGLCGHALCKWGGEKEKKMLTALLRGQLIGACGMQEPDPDLDSWDLKTKAAAAGNQFKLSGRKSMVVNAPLAGLTVITARTEQAPALFLVEKGAQGLEISPPQEKVGCRGAPTSDLVFSGCPGVALATGEAAVSDLRSREHLLLAALAAGITNEAMIRAGVFARDNKAGDKPLARHQEISFRLADMFLFLDTSQMLITRCVWLLDQGSDEAPVLASSAKCFATESAVKAAGWALQVMGQEGCKRGSVAERLYRDAKILEILGGPTERHRMFIADQVLAGD